MSFKQKVIDSLKSKGVQQAEIDQNVLQAINKNDYKSFRELGLVAAKKIQPLWNEIQNLKESFGLPTLKKKSFDLSLIHTRFPVENQNSQDSQIRAAIYGPCGHGKTTTINSLCGTYYDASQGETSLTRQITQSYSRIKFNPPFKLIDTPGTTSDTQKLKHATFLRQALTWKPLNTIFVLIKVHSRYNQLFLDLLFQAEIMKDNLSNVVFLATHLDAIEEPQQLMDCINRLLAQQKINCQVIYFSNKHCKKQDFCQKVYQIAKGMPQRQIVIDDKQFLKYFNLRNNEKQQLLFGEKQKKLIKEIVQLGSLYLQCAKQLPEDSQKADIVQDLSIHLKSDLSQLFNSYIEQNKELMAGLNYFTTFFSLQTKIADVCEQFQKATRQWKKEAYSTFGISGSKTDVRDLFKRCPNIACNLIWFRVQACPNTSCGQRPSSIWDFFKNVFFKYQVKKINGKIKLFGKQKCSYNEAGRKQKEAQFKSRQGYAKQLGCGTAMYFDSLPRLPNIQDILNQLYSVETLDNVVEKLKNPQYLKQNQKLEKFQNEVTNEVKQKCQQVLK